MRPRVVRRRPGFTNLSRSELSLQATLASGAETEGSAHIPESESDEHATRSDHDHRPVPASRPTVVVLGFRQLGFNAMVVCAGSSTRVQYHISVHLNCFVPTSSVTVVRHASVDGEFVGSFEMGISTQRATANMCGVERPLDAVLVRAGKKVDERIWQWRWDDDPSRALCWHRESPVRYCYIMDGVGRPSGPMVAAFTCQSIGADSASEGAQPQPAVLKVYPHGLRLADHILVSALVVERKRLTPSVMGFNSIFN
ncbi:hypothetical protein C8Q80DRAFT_346881 [Daedaleopsis nitida]|nr:hypothetical protein C8Q80DRAFT_346881 [Daedaleopsis nitida]